jgi:hypothetical protein
MVHLALGQRTRRNASSGAGRVVVIAISLILLGLASSLASSARATSQSAIAFSQIDSAPGAIATDHGGETTCPICGRLVCPIPDDLLMASPPNTALLAADFDPAQVVASVRLPEARAPDAAVSVFPTLFEARGPPFVG